MKQRIALDKLLSLHGKTALITGGAQGIGAAIAERYAEAGANLQLLDMDTLHNEKTADYLREKYDVKVSTYEVDLSDRAAIKDFWSGLDCAPDVLVNNAGVYTGCNFNDVDQVFYDRMMQINLGAVVQMCHGFIERRGKKRGGVIINIGSIEAKAAFKADMAIYATSKAGVLTFTRSLAREYAEKGYKINAIVPGGIKTTGTTRMAFEALRYFRLGILAVGMRFVQRVPLGRIGEPDDVARVALMLATPMSDYMIGAEIVVDGGFMAS